MSGDNVRDLAGVYLQKLTTGYFVRDNLVTLAAVTYEQIIKANPMRVMIVCGSPNGQWDLVLRSPDNNQIVIKHITNTEAFIMTIANNHLLPTFEYGGINGAGSDAYIMEVIKG